MLPFSKRLTRSLLIKQTPSMITIAPSSLSFNHHHHHHHSCTCCYRNNHKCYSSDTNNNSNNNNNNNEEEETTHHQTLSEKIDEMLNRDYGHLIKRSAENNSSNGTTNTTTTTTGEEADYIKETYGDPKLQQEIQEKIYRLRLSHMETFHVDQLMNNDELRQELEKQQQEQPKSGIAPKRTASAYAQQIQQRSRQEVRERQRRATQQQQQEKSNDNPRQYVKLVSR